MNVEDKLNQIPKGRLSRKADLAIKYRLYSIIWKQRLSVLAAPLSSVKFTYVTVSILLLCLLAGVPGFAYADDKIVPGNWLYPVKQIVEKIEVAVPKPAEEQVKVYDKLATRRLSEAKILSEVKNIDQAKISRTIEEAVNLNAEALMIASSVPAEAGIGVEKTNNVQMENLNKVARNIGLENEKLTDTVAIAMEKFKLSRRTKAADQTQANEDESAADDSASADNYISTTTEPNIQTGDQTVEASSSGTKLEIKNNWFGKSLNLKKNIKVKKDDNATSTAVSSSTPAENAANREKAEKNTRKDDLKNLKNKIKKLPQELKKEKLDKKETDKLINRLEDKLKEAEKAAEQDNEDNYDELMRSAEALTNNAKNFIKKEGEPKDDEKVKTEPNGKHNIFFNTKNKINYRSGH